MVDRQLLREDVPLDKQDIGRGIASFIDDHVVDREPPRLPPRVNLLGTSETGRQQTGSALGGAKENSTYEANNTTTPGGGLFSGNSHRQSANGSQNNTASQQTSQALKKPVSSKLAYGKLKAEDPHRHHDMNDKVHDLQSENLRLKEKENLLELEIKKMQTKLQRIDELIGKTRTTGGGGDSSDYGRLARELEEQFGTFKDENTVLKDRVRKLKTVVGGLSQQLQGPPQKTATKAYNPKGSSSAARKSSVSKRPQTSHGGVTSSMGKVNVSSSLSMSQVHFPAGTSLEQQRLIADMREQMKRNQVEISRLERERDKYQVPTGQVTVDDLLRKIREREGEIRDISHQFDHMEAEFIKKEKIFIDSKVYMEEIIKQIQEAKSNNQVLAHKNIVAQIQFSQNKSMQDQLRGLEGEKQTLENSIRNMAMQPFLNRKGGEDPVVMAAKRQAHLEQMLVDKEKAFRAVKEEEHKKEHDLKNLIPTIERLKGECDLLKRENDKMKTDFTKHAAEFEEFNVYHTLFKMDPQKYATTINDMNQKREAYPIWSELDFLERPADGTVLDDVSKIGNVRTAKELKDQISQLRLEILKLRQENKDFAAELEKAQNLLQLQRDIERDNTKYYENEKERLVVMQKSVQLKAEELVRRADEKARQLQEIQKKLGLSITGQYGTIGDTKQQSPMKDTRGGADLLDKLETQSEFSAVTNESEIRPEENVLDLAIQDAEYYYDAFKTVLDEKEMLLHSKTLVTFVTIDFYNHDTETSQLAEGFRPLYNTQFSFKNKVDDFYVQFLQKQTVKIDVYISKNNAAVHLGHAEVFLRELIERETPLQDANTFKTPVIQKPIRIFGARNTHTNTEQHIGILKLKMRLRRPVGEQVRYYRERNEIETLKTMDIARATGSTVTLNQRKKMITIQVVGARDLKVKYGDVANVSPFFYYQFYDFDERYSATAIGKSPLFEDTQNYEVIFDAKMVSYLQRENLEIILFDDNAPITGNDRGAQAAGEQAEDMIGSALIPLGELVKGASIHDKYPIRKIGGGRNAQESVGTIEVKMSIVDVHEGGTMSNLNKKSMSISQAALHYNASWEKDLIYRIAKRLASIPGEVELHFGVFARGQKTVTKEDFKYTCLKTLRLSSEITEREMDMFLHSCPRLMDKQIITHEDFVMLFSASITNARHDIMDENAMKMQTIRQYEQVQAQQSLARRSYMGGADDNVFREGALSATRGHTSLNYSEQEIVDILSKMRAQSTNGEHTVVQRLKQLGGDHGSVVVDTFVTVLIREGNISKFDADRVATFFGANKSGEINLIQFLSYLSQAQQIQAMNSQAVQKFIKLLQSTQGEGLTRAIIAQDIDKDGYIRLDGFKAAILSPEYMLKVDEASEIFFLLSREGMFSYKDILVEYNPNLRNLIQGSVRALSSVQSHSQLNNRSESNLGLPLESGRNGLQHNISQVLPPSSNLGGRNDNLDLSLNESRASLIGQSINFGQNLNQSTTQNLVVVEDQKMRVIKNKLKQYMTSQDITLATLFQLIDTNSDQQLTISEFKQKMKALQVQMTDEELVQLFQYIDRAQRGTIDYKSFVAEFPEINISYMLKKIKNILRGSRTSEEMVFNEFCTDRSADVEQKKMSLGDFKRFVRKYIEKAQDFEIEMLFKHFAVDVMADLTKSLSFRDFKEAFGREVRDLTSSVACNIEDIIKPLATKIRLFKVNISVLFEKYDKNQNRRLSAEELAYALKQDMKIDLQEDEINAIREYFRNRHNSIEINELDFIALLNFKFTRTFDEIDARKSLSILKTRVYQGLGRSAMQICQPFDTEGVKRLSLRNFKHAIHSLKILSQFQIDNLTKYLDTLDDGFIAVDHFDAELRNSQSMTVGASSAHGSSIGRGNSMSMRSEGGTMSGITTQKWKAPNATSGK